MFVSDILDPQGWTNKEWPWSLTRPCCPHLPAQYTGALSLPQSQHLPCLTYHLHPRAATTVATSPKLKLATKGHTVPPSWTGLQPYSKAQQSQQPLDPPSVAAEKHPATEIHAPSFLGRRTEVQGTPIEAIPRLYGHRTHTKKDRVPQHLRKHSTLILWHLLVSTNLRSQFLHALKI